VGASLVSDYRISGFAPTRYREVVLTASKLRPVALPQYVSIF